MRWRLKTLLSLTLVLALAGARNPIPAAPAPDSPELQFTDAAGRAVRLPGPPRRIAVIGKGYHLVLHTLFMFPEARERVVGSEKRSRQASDFLSAVFPEFNKRTFLNANPGPEQIAGLHPDLVLAKHLTAGNLHEPLSKIGIPVLYLNLETPEDFLEEVVLLGRLLGNPERAGEISDYFQARLDRIRRGIAGLEEEDKLSVLVVMYKRRGGTTAVQVPAVNWTQTLQVRRAGGIPVWVESAQAAGSWTIVNLEQIASWDPERIFVVVPHSLDPLDVLGSLRADNRWKSLRAVRAGGPEAFPADHFGWDSPEPRWILGLTWLAGRLYPERFPDLDMENELNAYFGRLYGMDESEVDRVVRPLLTPGTLDGR